MAHLKLPDGAQMPPFGLGTWRMGERDKSRSAEIAALQCGLDLGVRLIDTAEMYGDGGAEKIVAAALAGRRDEVFLVSKVLPGNASRKGTIAACERSLKRLATDRIDLYLLHWPGSHPLSETVSAFEQLRKDGKIRHWGVSNFDAAEMAELAGLEHGGQCAANQVYYSASRRGIEFDLLPWLRERQVPLMAYCPLDQGELARDQTLRSIGQAHEASAAQVAIAWLLAQPQVVPIPKAVQLEHVRGLIAAQQLQLTAQDLAAIDARFPPPTKPQSLAIV